MKRLIAILLLTLAGVGAAHAAAACNTYRLDPYNSQWGYYDGLMEERRSGALTMNADGTVDVTDRDGTTHFTPVGGGSTNLHLMIDQTKSEEAHYQFVDLRRIVKKGMPTRILIWDGQAYWPSCNAKVEIHKRPSTHCSKFVLDALNSGNPYSNSTKKILRQATISFNDAPPTPEGFWHQITLIEGGRKTDFNHTSCGNGGLNCSGAQPKDESISVTLQFIELSQIAKPGASTGFLLWGSDVFWPACQR